MLAGMCCGLPKGCPSLTRLQALGPQPVSHLPPPHAKSYYVLLLAVAAGAAGLTRESTADTSAATAATAESPPPEDEGGPSPALPSPPTSAAPSSSPPLAFATWLAASLHDTSITYRTGQTYLQVRVRAMPLSCGPSPTLCAPHTRYVPWPPGP